MKRLWTLIAWVTCILLVNCLAHTPLPFAYYGNAPYSEVALKTIPIYLDKNFGAADLVAIDDAITQWNYALNGYVVLKVVSTQFDMEPETIRSCLSGACWMIIKINSTSSFIPDASPLTKTLAWANDVGGNRIFVVRDRFPNEYMTGIMLHEMGHLLGAPHDDMYLMAPRFNWEDSRCVDYGSMRLVADYWHVPPSKMKYCVYGSSTK